MFRLRLNGFIVPFFYCSIAPLIVKWLRKATKNASLLYCSATLIVKWLRKAIIYLYC